MVYFDYKPLFNYLEENGITKDTLVREQVAAEGAINRMKHHKNIETATICRIMDYLQITDLSKIMTVVEVKDDEPCKVQPVMRYDYYVLHPVHHKYRKKQARSH